MSKSTKQKFVAGNSKRVNGSNSHIGKKLGKQQTKPSFDKKIDDDNRNLDSGASVTQGVAAAAGKPRPVITNDPGWYENIPDLAANVGTLFFSEPAGKSDTRLIQLPYLSKSGSFVSKKAWVDLDSPTITTIYWMPTWGEGTGVTSAINTFCYRVLWKLVGKQTRNTAYTAGDVGQLFMNTDAIYMHLYEAIRIYGLLNKFSSTNYAFGRNAVEALGWDWEATRDAIGDLRYYINNTIRRVNIIHIPKACKMLSRHQGLLQSLYADVPSDKAQYYAFTTGGYWLFDDATGVSTWYPRRSAPGMSSSNHYRWTPATWLAAADQMLDAVISSDFQAIMDADMTKAFTDAEMINFPSMADDYVTEPIYDPLMLVQISNMEWVRAVDSYGNAEDPTTGMNVVIGTYTTVPTSTTSTRVDYLRSYLGVGRTTDASSTYTIDYANTIPQRTSITAFTTINKAGYKCINLPTILEKKSGVILEATRLMFNIMSNKAHGSSSGMYYASYSVSSVGDGWCYGMTSLVSRVSANHSGGSSYDMISIPPVLDYDRSIWTTTPSGATTSGILSALFPYAVLPPIYYCTSSGESETTYKLIREVQDKTWISTDMFEHINYVAVSSLWDWNNLFVLG